MTDIVERLWEYGTVVGKPLTAQDKACHDAADEIERLRRLLRKALANSGEFTGAEYAEFEAALAGTAVQPVVGQEEK